MDTWNERLAFALAESDYNALQLAQALGVSAPSVSAWLGSGAIQPAKNITGENLLRVCELLDIRPEWLMFKKGPMRPASVKLSAEMSAIIATLQEIDLKNGTDREDALYFINRLLQKSASQHTKTG
jgi:DNA-binding Xre family transcriptional regulator